MSPPEYFDTPFDYYHKHDKGYYPIQIGEDIEGDTFNTLQEWYDYPYKYKIMNEAMEFKQYLRKISKPNVLQTYLGILHTELGRCHEYSLVDTPIIEEFRGDFIEYLIKDYEKAVYGELGYSVPSSLVNTDIGKKILYNLKNTKYSDLVFCHNALYYKSFIVKDNRLIGIRNWKYAGLYPPEFEDAVHPYLEYIF